MADNKPTEAEQSELMARVMQKMMEARSSDGVSLHPAGGVRMFADQISKSGPYTTTEIHDANDRASYRHAVQGNKESIQYQSEKTGIYYEAFCGDDKLVRDKVMQDGKLVPNEAYGNMLKNKMNLDIPIFVKTRTFTEGFESIPHICQMEDAENEAILRAAQADMLKEQQSSDQDAPVSGLPLEIDNKPEKSGEMIER